MDNLHEIAHTLQQAGVRPNDVDAVVRVVEHQMIAPSEMTADVELLINAAVPSHGHVGRLKWSNITLKKGYVASKWKMASFDGKGNDVLDPSDLRELAHRILAR